MITRSGKVIVYQYDFLSFLPIASDILTEVTNKQWLGSNTIGHWGGFGHTLINLFWYISLVDIYHLQSMLLYQKRNCYLLYKFVH